MKHTPNVSEVEDLLTKKLRVVEKLSLLGIRLLTLCKFTVRHVSIITGKGEQIPGVSPT